MSVIRLNERLLEAPPANLSVPSYDRAAISPGIVHIGVGNFHRAHLSAYLNELFNLGRNHDWGIVGAGVRPADAVMREKLKSQDWLTTLVKLGPEAISAEIVGSMIDFVPVEEGNGPLISAMVDPRIRIVTLTITEGGYYIDPATKRFCAAHPDIQFDAANPDTPRTAFGAMIAALKRRRENGSGPFTGLCCDNLHGNGKVLQSTLLSLARLSSPDLADWIEAHCTFPNSLVDCIVPSTGPKEVALAREFGIEDAAPVTHEPFRQWVIEDNFCAGRPDWAMVGATFTDKVDDYETIKIRILNGGHQILSLVGDLMGIEFMSETMEDHLLRRYFRKIEEEEIIPHVKPVPGYTPPAYLDMIDSRFSNPAILDTTRRVAFDASSRQPGFVLPSVRDGLRSGAPVEGLALVSAAWCRYCFGTRDDGSMIEPNDPMWPELQARAILAVESPITWLAMTNIYGELANQPRFANAFVHWSKEIRENGIRAALETYCH